MSDEAKVSARIEEKTHIASDAYLNEGFNCSKSIMKAYADEIGIDEISALNMIEGLGGGIGGRQKECGAVLAAACAVSAAVNRMPGVKKPDVYASVEYMCDYFIGELGSTCCFELMDGRKPFKHCCPDKVEIAVKAAEMAIAAAQELYPQAND